MGTVKYQQANPVPGRELAVAGSTDVFIFQMTKAFGKFPTELTKDNIERLQGMAAMSAEPNPYRELIMAVNRLGSVRVWAEYD